MLFVPDNVLKRGGTISKTDSYMTSKQPWICEAILKSLFWRKLFTFEDFAIFLVKQGVYESLSLVKTTIFHLLTFSMGKYRWMTHFLIKELFVRENCYFETYLYLTVLESNWGVTPRFAHPKASPSPSDSPMCCSLRHLLDSGSSPLVVPPGLSTQSSSRRDLIPSPSASSGRQPLLNCRRALPWSKNQIQAGVEVFLFYSWDSFLLRRRPIPFRRGYLRPVGPTPRILSWPNSIPGWGYKSSVTCYPISP